MFIDVERLSFRYPNGHQVLSDLTFFIDRGCSLAILGPSGCGKSTLLRLLAGLLQDSSMQGTLGGSIRIDGLLPIEYRRKGRVSFMFQEPTLLPHLTVIANVLLPLRILGRDNDQRAYEVVDMVGLSKFSHYLPKDLSGGMKARVALARSFVTNPNVLLLDEPFVSLDMGWKTDLYSELRMLCSRRDVTLFLVTHDVHEALELTTDILVLNSGGKVGLLSSISEINDEATLHSSVTRAILEGHPAIADNASALNELGR